MFWPVIIDPLRWATSHCFLEMDVEFIGIWVLRHVTVVDGTERITLPMWRKRLRIASQVVEDHPAHSRRSRVWCSRTMLLTSPGSYITIYLLLLSPSSIISMNRTRWRSYLLR